MQKVLKIVQKTYDELKSFVVSSFQKKDYLTCIDQISVLAKFAYYNCYCYTDDKIEDYLVQISNSIIGTDNIAGQRNRWVLYDAYFRDNAVLTEQYLKAFLKYNVEVMIICETYNPQKAARLLSLVENNPNVRIVSVNQTLNTIDKLKGIRDVIYNYHPDKVFIQIYPWSAEAVVLLNSLQGLDRYFINATDHSFWLGRNCADYSLEFREMGCTITKEKRKIPSERILLNTFYASVGENYRYDGIPESISADSIILMSGGGLYKVYDTTWTFFSLVKKVLDENPRTVLLFPGLGETKPFIEFIKKNKFEKRIFLLGHRQDIYQLINRCDIYLNTYPISGGLMCNIAAHYEKPIIAYRPESNRYDLVEYLLGYDLPAQITYFTYDEYAAEVKKLCNNIEYRKDKGLATSRSCVSEQKFNDRLFSLVSNNRDDRLHNVVVNYVVERDCYLANEENVFFCTKILLKKYGIRTLYLFPNFMYFYLPKYIKTVIKTKLSK